VGRLSGADGKQEFVAIPTRVFLADIGFRVTEITGGGVRHGFLGDSWFVSCALCFVLCALCFT